MSDALEVFEHDIAWLKAKLPLATDNQCDSFCEKVANFVCTEGKSEAFARFSALNLIKNRAAKC